MREKTHRIPLVDENVFEEIRAIYYSFRSSSQDDTDGTSSIVLPCPGS